MKVVIAGGTGSLGRRLAGVMAGLGHHVTVLTRRRRPDLNHRQVVWDGRTVGAWAGELDGAMVINLAGELVDRRPTPKNLQLLRTSRVEPTRALVAAALMAATRPPLWLQMSTLAIYGDAGDDLIVEGHPAGDGPPQMVDVATPWEAAAADAPTDRLVILRTGIVLDRDTPALDRLVTLTRRMLGGRIGSGRQWVSWIHAADFLDAVRFLIEHNDVAGPVHVTSPHPIRNRDTMAALRSALKRPWTPPTPKPLVHVGAWLMRTDPALALTGRRCLPARLTQAGFRFEHPTFREAITDLLDGANA